MYTFALLASLAVSRTPHAESRINRYDVLEFNDYASDFSRLRQVIAWDWSPTDSRHYAQWYAMLIERADGSHIYSLSKTGDGLYRLRVHGQTVEARSVRFTKTSYDPETHDREIFRQDQRRQVKRGMPFLFRVPEPAGEQHSRSPPPPVDLPNWLQALLGRVSVSEK